MYYVCQVPIKENQDLCTAMTFSTHFLWVAAFAWTGNKNVCMLSDAVKMYNVCHPNVHLKRLKWFDILLAQLSVVVSNQVPKSKSLGGDEKEIILFEKLYALPQTIHK